MAYLICNPEAPEALDNNSIKLQNGLNTIGRHQDNSIVLPHLSLSRQHATITIANNCALLIDSQSRNGTFVNDTKVEQCELQENDIIRCGDVTFKFVSNIGNGNEQPSEDKKLNVVTRLTPSATQIKIQDLLDQKSSTSATTGSESVLKLRHVDPNQRSLDKLQILLEVSKQLSSPENLDNLLEKILDLLFKIMFVDRAVILMADDATNQLESKAMKSSLRNGVGAGSNRMFYSHQIVDFVYKHGDAIITDDAFIDERFEESDSVQGQLIRASMCVPLKPKDRTIGVLYVDNLSKSSVYCLEDLEFLAGLASQAAIAIENAKLYQRIEDEAVMLSKFECFFPETVSRKLKEEGTPEIIDTEVTALFSDISSFTELASSMEPRQVIAMLNEYFELMVEGIVFKYEGTLEKYIGDALLAVWGAPYRTDDDADLAVKAAIAMQWATHQLNKRWITQRNLQIQIHIGLNTGKVAAGNIGSKKLMQYATIGDTTNVASRICNVAKAGEIIMAQSTYDRLKDTSVPMEKLAPVFVRGKAEPLQLYRIQWNELPLQNTISSQV